MRLPASLKPRQAGRVAISPQNVAELETINAPTRGWVVSENLADLGPDAAGVMDNWYPEPDDVRVRPGSDTHAIIPAEFDFVADNSSPRGFWSNGTFAYCVDLDATIYVYNLRTGALVDEIAYTVPSGNTTRGAWSNGTTIWIVDQVGMALRAYTLATGAQDPAKDITLDVAQTVPEGVWSDETTIYVSDDGANQVFAYVLATGARDAPKDFNLDASNTNPRGIWSDFTTMWVADVADELLYAYTLATGALDSAKNISLADPPNNDCFDIWSDTAFMWVTDTSDRRAYIYSVVGGTRSIGGGNVEVLMPYQAGAQSNLFAAANNNIYDVTSSIVSLALSGQTSNDYVYINHATSAGQFLLAANGTDHPVNFNGTTFTATPTITGTDPADLFAPVSYQQRIFWLVKDSSDVIYMPVDAFGGPIGGTIAVGGFLEKGGSIIAGASWTIDAEDGPDDYLVLISSEGEAVIYQGTDPGTPADFRFRGKFFIGRPIGKHCILNLGVDLAVLTTDGLVSFARSITIDQTARDRSAFTDNIEKEFVEAFRRIGDVFGWQITTYPTLNMAIVNVPVTAGVSYQQYVMNVLTGAWARFLGLEAFHWTLLRNDIYFGGHNGEVVVFDRGANDRGVAINAEMVMAYTDLGHPGVFKHIQSGQAFYQASVQSSISVGFAADFRDPGQLSSISPGSLQESSVLIWDVGVWDTGTWASDETPVKVNRVGGNVGGHRIAPVVAATTDASPGAGLSAIRFNSINILYHRGGPVA